MIIKFLINKYNFKAKLYAEKFCCEFQSNKDNLNNGFIELTCLSFAHAKNICLAGDFDGFQVVTK